MCEVWAGAIALYFYGQKESSGCQKDINLNIPKHAMHTKTLYHLLLANLAQNLVPDHQCVASSAVK